MPSPALCLDLTRLLSRVGRGPLTGVDRVERAYGDWVLSVDPDPRFLVRTSRGYLIFGKEGAAAFFSALDQNTSWPRPDLLSRLYGKGKVARHGAEVLLRRFALGRAIKGRLPHLLRTHLRPSTTYLNTGHANLTEAVLRAVGDIPKARTAVFIHDVIPLDQPEYSSPGMPEKFEAMLARVNRHADLIICNSHDTKSRLRAHGVQGQIVPAHLGLHSEPVPERLPHPLDPEVAHFVVLGTIEPRKNHAVLLEAWEGLPEKGRPHLHIVGRRGWAAPDLLQRLDAHPQRGISIFEHPSLTDGQVATLMASSCALLFPTLAEGFGLPAIEAARAGVLPICADLPVLREILGNRAVYLDPNDAVAWAETIKKHSGASLGGDYTPWDGYPTWQAHFETVSQAVLPGRAEG